MKKIFLLVMLMLPLVASAQDFKSRGTFVFDSTTADTIEMWFSDFKAQAWSLDLDYTAVDTSFKIAIIVSNFSTGSFSYYPSSGVAYPVTLNPTADRYRDQNHVYHASDMYSGSSIKYKRFGLRIIKTGIVLGPLEYFLKQ